MAIDILTLAAARAGKGGGGSSKYKQPDWGAEGEKTILQEVTCEIDPESGMGMIMQQFSIVEGVEYIVNYNGTPYNCIAAYLEGTGVAVGNVAAVVGTGNTGEPFVVVSTTDEENTSMGVYGAMMSFDGSTSVTVSIRSNVIHKIPEEYVENPAAPLYVKLNADSLSAVTGCDVDYETILSAIKDGKTVLFHTEGDDGNTEYYSPISADNTAITFMSASLIDTIAYLYISTLENDGSFTTNRFTLNR